MTRNQPTYREKGRALFLAAMMVLSVFAMSAALAGGAAAATNADEADFDLNEDSDALDGSDFWIGEQLTVHGPSEDGFSDPVRLYQGLANEDEGEEIVTIRPNDEGVVTFDTSDLEDGSPYFIRESGTDTEYGSIWANTHEFSASLDPSTTNADSTLSIDTNLDNVYHDSLEVSVSEANDKLDDEAIESLFGGTQITVDSAEYDQSVSFEDVEDGDYTFVFESTVTDAETSVDVTVEEPPETDVYFADDSFEEERGDVLTSDIYLQGASAIDTVELQIASDYEASLSIDVSDVNEDGYITVHWNTYETGTDDAFWVTNDDGLVDEGVVESQTDIGVDELPETTYPVNLYHNDPGLDNRDATDTFHIGSSSQGNVTNWIAPGDTDTSDLDTILDSATQNDEVAQGDLLIHEYDISGIYGAAYDGTDFDVNNVEDFLGLTVQSQYDQNADEAFQDPVYESWDSDEEDLTFFADEDTNTLYVVVDTGEIDSFDEEGTHEEPWDATVSIDGNNYDLVEDDETVDRETTYSVVEGVIELDLVESPYTMTPDADAEIRGSSTFAPGTEFDVEVAMDTVFRNSETLTVQEDFSWAYTADHSDREEGDEFTITMPDDEEVVGEFSATPEWETTTDLEALADLLGVEQGEIYEAVEDLLDERDSLEDDLEDANNNISDLNNTITDLNNTITDLEGQISDLEDERDEAQSNYEDAQDEIDTLEEQIDDLNEQLENAPDQSTVDDLNDQISTLEDDLETAQEERDTAQSDLSDAQDEISSLEDEISTLEDDLETAQDDLETAEEERDAAQSDLDEINSTLDGSDYDSVQDAIDAADSTGTDEGNESDDEGNESDDESDDESSGDDGTPGFGIAVALTALLGAAMLAIRRQN